MESCEQNRKKPQPFAEDFQGKNDLWRKCIGTQCKVEGAAGHSTHTHTHTDTATAPPGESRGRRTRISFSTFSLHNNNFYAAGVCFFFSSLPFFIAPCAFCFLLFIGRVRVLCENDRLNWGEGAEGGEGRGGGGTGGD